jgi:acetolactate synthase-1/2/3 large subunit
MTGAESLVRSLLNSGIDTCFANPGTSEMHFVAALDKVDGIRCGLGLAETVVTGCADGYARMAERPAATLLHCGPGFANGIANLHNARRANSSIVNIVGDHASYHRAFDPPLASDIEALTRAASHWVRVSASSSEVGFDGATAVQIARSVPGQIATLILPADTAWNDGGKVADSLSFPSRNRVRSEVVSAIAQVLKTEEPAILILAGQALSEPGLAAAARVSSATGAKLRATAQVPRMARGRGRSPVDRIPYAVDGALQVFQGIRHVILIGAKPPVAFFAYPGKPSMFAPAEAAIHVLARPEDDALEALVALADELAAPQRPSVRDRSEKPRVVAGPFEASAFATTLAAVLPENCIVVEDAVTSGRDLFPATFDAAPHDWLQITGGAIGHAFPCATGAAVACGDRKVVCLQSDGGGMYSLQALWTQASQRLNVVNVVFANRKYKILNHELLAVGAKPGRVSAELFDIGNPTIDWVRLAEGMGVEALRVDTLQAFAEAFRAACTRAFPFLIEFQI